MNEYKEYGYHFQIGGDRLKCRPLLGIELKYGDATITTDAIIDSGCDIMMVNSEFAEVLGIDRTKFKRAKVGGIVNEAIDSFVAPIEVKIEGFDEYFKFDVIFVDGLRTSSLLGQDDIFEKFNIKFEKNKGKFYLQRVSGSKKK